MKYRPIVEIYEALVNQSKNKVGKTIDLIYPPNSNNIIAKDIKITLKMLKIYESRRDFWIGGNK